MIGHRKDLTRMIVFFASMIFILQLTAMLIGIDGKCYGISIGALGVLIGYWLRYYYKKIKDEKAQTSQQHRVQTD